MWGDPGLVAGVHELRVGGQALRDGFLEADLVLNLEEAAKRLGQFEAGLHGRLAIFLSGARMQVGRGPVGAVEAQPGEDVHRGPQAVSVDGARPRVQGGVREQDLGTIPLIHSTDRREVQGQRAEKLLAGGLGRIAAGLDPRVAPEGLRPGLITSAMGARQTCESVKAALNARFKSPELLARDLEKHLFEDARVLWAIAGATAQSGNLPEEKKEKELVQGGLEEWKTQVKAWIEAGLPCR